MKKSRINQLIEEHQCQIYLTPVPPEDDKPARMCATYAYTWGEADCRFSLGSEIAESLVPAFQRILDRHGLLISFPLELTRPPWLKDTVRPDPGTPAGRRWLRLMPDMVPRYVRVYDNGGETADRYTAVFSGVAAKSKGIGSMPDQWPYLAMSGSPFHPQGFGQHRHTNHFAADVQTSAWPPVMGRTCHLGKRIPFAELPEDCRKYVIQDYLEIWKL